MSSGKKIEIKNLRELRNARLSNHDDARIDAWVEGNNKELIPTESMGASSNPIPESRFTIVIPKYLHRRIKKSCAINDVSMKDTLIRILEEAFPET